jgi:hypothetical protein
MSVLIWTDAILKAPSTTAAATYAPGRKVADIDMPFLSRQS